MNGNKKKKKWCDLLSREGGRVCAFNGCIVSVRKVFSFL